MSIASIGGAVNPSGNNNSLSTLSKDYESFLTLLVAQVKHQDPLEPIDATQFISQLSTLTQVEQSVNMNEQLGSLRTSLAMSGALSQTALIGRNVTVPSETVTLGPDGATFSYETEGKSDEVVAVITDANGTILRHIRGLIGTSGELTDVTWDGLDDNGVPAPMGSYGISLAAEESAGGYNTYASHQVASVAYTGGMQILNLVGGGSANSGDIVRIQ